MKRNGNFGFNSALLEKKFQMGFLPYFRRGITEAGNDVSKDLVFLWLDKCCTVCSAK